jgi:hypothetical protein
MLESALICSKTQLGCTCRGKRPDTGQYFPTLRGDVLNWIKTKMLSYFSSIQTMMLSFSFG